MLLRLEYFLNEKEAKRKKYDLNFCKPSEKVREEVLDEGEQLSSSE